MLRAVGVLLAVSLGAATADAESIWCGTFAPERVPLTDAAGRSPAEVHRFFTDTKVSPPADIDRSRVDHVRVDGVLDSGARRVIASQLELRHVAVGAVWSVTMVVDRRGVVVQAHVNGDGARGVVARLLELRFPRGVVRTITARITTL